MGVKFTIDPGHVKGYNTGVSAGYAEGTAMFNLAKYLKTELEKYSGFSVVLTRTAVEQNPALEQRGQIAVSNGSKVFISLHSNAFSSSSAKGVVLFYSLRRAASKPLADKLGNAVTDLMNSGTGVTYYRGSQTRAYPGTTGTDYYGVIRSSVKGANVEHSFLIEHGFHTNPEECAWLNSDANLRAIARTEAAVFAEYFGVAAGGNTSGGNESPEDTQNGPVNVTKGDVVHFKGGAVYTSANATQPATNKGESTCDVTNTYKGKHPYHLISNDGGGVYGWVDADTIGGGTTTHAPTMREGAKVEYSGPLYADSLGGGKGKTVNGTYSVTRCIAGRKCGVLLNGGLGWVPESGCRVIG